MEVTQSHHVPPGWWVHLTWGIVFLWGESFALFIVQIPGGGMGLYNNRCITQKLTNLATGKSNSITAADSQEHSSLIQYVNCM